MAENENQIHQEHQQQSSPPQYEYKVLSDILEGPIPVECNLYAVIVECSVPRPTRRVGEWFNILGASSTVFHYAELYSMEQKPSDLGVLLQTGCATQGWWIQALWATSTCRRVWRR